MFTDHKQQRRDLMHVSLEDTQACLLTEICLGFVSVTKGFEIPPTFLGGWMKVCDAWADERAQRWNDTAPSSSANSTYSGQNEAGPIYFLWELMWWLLAGEKFIYTVTGSRSDHQVKRADSSSH